MAKAKDWAMRFETAPDLGAELLAFFGEIGDIAQARGNTPNAVEGAVREQKTKFMAVCGHTQKVNAGMWPVLMEAHGQEYIRGVKQYLKTCGPKQPAKGGRLRGGKNARPLGRAA